MLMHHGNPLPLRFERGPALDRDAADEDIADIGPVDSRQQLYARALASAILAKQSEHLAPP